MIVLMNVKVMAPTQTLWVNKNGEYSWSNSLVYYIKKYNLRIPKKFEKEI